MIFQAGYGDDILMHLSRDPEVAFLAVGHYVTEKVPVYPFSTSFCSLSNPENTLNLKILQWHQVHCRRFFFCGLDSGSRAISR